MSTNPTLFGKLQKGIIDHISNNALLQEIKKRRATSNIQEESLLESAIDKLDTLRQAYNQRLLKGQNATSPSGNQLTVLDASPLTKTPELDLYDKMLELSDQLKECRTRSVTE